MAYFCIVKTIEPITNLGEGIALTSTMDTIFWFLMGFNLVVIAIVQTLHPHHIKDLFLVTFSKAGSNSLIDLGRFTSVLLNFTYLTCLGIIVTKYSNQTNELILLFVLLGILGVLFVKLISIRILASLANTKKGFLDHINNHFIFFQLGGVILTPVLLFTNSVPTKYNELMIIAIVLLLTILILIREFKSILKALEYKISILYIILYLCTLEILPLVIGVRVFIQNSAVLN
jgi:hypothetical protein